MIALSICSFRITFVSFLNFTNLKRLHRDPYIFLMGKQEIFLVWNSRGKKAKTTCSTDYKIPLRFVHFLYKTGLKKKKKKVTKRS